MVLLFEESIFLFKLNVTIEQPPGLLDISALTETRLSLGENSLHDSGFLCQSQAIGPDDFPRALGWCIANISTDIRVSADIVDSFCPVVQKVIIQKIWIGVIIKIAGFLVIVLHEKNGLDIPDVIEH